MSLLPPRRCEAVCPYAGRKHKSNNLYLVYDHSRSSVRIKCHDKDCKAAAIEIRLPSNDPLITKTSLHDYQGPPVWADDYDDEKMKPYPSAKGTVAAIVAGMGMGERPLSSSLNVDHAPLTTRPPPRGQAPGGSLQPHLPASWNQTPPAYA